MIRPVTQTIDPTVSSTTSEQLIIAVGVLALVVMALLVGLYRLRWTGLNAAQRARKEAISGQLRDQTPGSVRFGSVGELRGGREAIRDAFDTAGRVDESATLRDAGNTALDVAREATRPYRELVPPRVRRAGALGVSILAFGAVGLSTEKIADALRSDGSLIVSPLWRWPALAISESVAVADAVVSAVSGLPVVGDVATFLFALATAAVGGVFESYLVLGVGLLGSAAALWWHESNRPDDRRIDPILPDPRRVGRIVLVTVTVSWIVVLLAIGLDRVVTRTRGADAGAIVALVTLAVTAVVVGVVVWGWLSELRLALRLTSLSDRDLAAGVTHTVVLALTVVGAALLPAYVVVGLSGLPAVVTAWFAASASVKLVTGLVAAGVVGGVAYALREAADDVREAIAEASARAGVRTAVLTRGVPLGVVVPATVGAAGLGAPPIVAVVIGATIGVVTSVVVRRLDRLKYRARLRDSKNLGVGRVLIHGYRLDVNGETVWYARVNGTPLAHTNRATLVDEIQRLGTVLFNGDDPEPALAEAFAADASERGTVDVGETRDRLRAEVRRRIEGSLLSADHRVREREELVGELRDEYPADVVNESLSNLRHTGRLRVDSERVQLRDSGGVAERH